MADDLHQSRSGYNRRSLIEIAMFRYKTIIGRRLHATTLPNQRTEAKIGRGVLSRVTPLGMRPVHAPTRVSRPSTVCDVSDWAAPTA
jgi:hypothetical protein